MSPSRIGLTYLSMITSKTIDALSKAAPDHEADIYSYENGTVATTNPPLASGERRLKGAWPHRWGVPPVRESPTELGFHLLCWSFRLTSFFEIDSFFLSLSGFEICALQGLFPSDSQGFIAAYTIVDTLFRRELETVA